jgi:sialic acid synthase
MARELIIDQTIINDENDCYVVAEIGHNHQGNIETAKEMFRSAMLCGVNAVKLQKRDNKSLFTKAMYNSPYENENSFGPTYGLHREALEFGRPEYIELIAYAKQLGLTLFATAFDFNSTDFLADLNMPAIKIASADLTNTPLLKHIARLQKPMILSTGGGTMIDVQRAYDAIMPINSQLAILQCTAGYPVESEDMNLQVIPAFRQLFKDCVIGLSDHQSGIAMAVVAYTLGARIVEKHFTLNRAWKGTDQAFSLEAPGLRRLVRDLKRARGAMGDGIKQILPKEEKPMLKMQKKLVAARDLKSGQSLTLEDICIKSPGVEGIPPYYLDTIIGATVMRDIKEDDTLLMDWLSIDRH